MATREAPAAQLEALLEPYRIAFEASPVGMAFVSPDWRFVECNPALCEMLGRSEEELRGRSATEFTHPEDTELHLPGQRRLLDGDIDDYALEARYVRPDGFVGWVSVHVGVLRDPEGAIKLVIALIEDINDRLSSDLFDAIVSDDPPDTASLVRWGRRLGHDLDDFTLIAYVQPADAEPDAGPTTLTRLTRTVAGVAREAAPGSLVVPRGNVLLVAVAAEDPAAAEKIAARLVERISALAGIKIVVGLSRPVPTPAELGVALNEARQALGAVVAMPRLGPVAAYGDLDLHNLMLGGKPSVEIERAAGTTLAPLLDLENERSRERLVETLVVYLDSVGQLEATSRKLGIHVNTLRQRITRIEEALELDLTDARVRVNLQLALEVLGLSRAAR